MDLRRGLLSRSGSGEPGIDEGLQSLVMEFRIADTFTDSLARLTGDEQKAVKTTAFDLQINPAHPGMSLHKLDKANDKNFWSVRVSSDIRLIVTTSRRRTRPRCWH
jgi:mRNA-degrading endonuclease RelE of RelBE toxin-antitoxin system